MTAGTIQVEPSRSGNGARSSVQTAVRAAERLLADTVHDVNPDSSASALLSYAERYRAQLAHLVAACRAQAE